MTIGLQETNWKVVKRRIDNLLSEKPDSIECTICEDFNKYENNMMVSCNKCGNNYCKYCYIDIMRTNKGLIICPFCRDVVGRVFPEEIVEQLIRKIL
jgi:ribosomal protein L37AE/L43A